MRLPVVEDYDYLRRIRIPNGVYVSTKGMHNYSDQDAGDDEEDTYGQGSKSRHSSAYRQDSSNTAPSYSYPVTSTLAHAHAAYGQSSHLPSSHLRPSSSSHASAAYPPAESHSYSYTTPYGHVPQTARLPNLNHTAQPSPSSYLPDSSKPPYIPLTSEDKRALGAFRVAL